jgi:hypothetical protein
MRYDPENKAVRMELALELLGKMHETGFVHEPIEGTKEAVFSRPVEGMKNLRVLVYTSIVQGPQGPEVRGCGTDAIRVCAVYRSSAGRDRGCAKAEARVFRVGETENIVSRTHERMREVYKQAKSLPCCSKCGAPLFLSKKGNSVCADLCWTQSPAR